MADCIYHHLESQQVVKMQSTSQKKKRKLADESMLKYSTDVQTYRSLTFTLSINE